MRIFNLFKNSDLLFVTVFVLLTGVCWSAWGAEPFVWHLGQQGDQWLLQCRIQDNCYLYQESLEVLLDGDRAVMTETEPKAITYYDPIFEEEVEIFPSPSLTIFLPAEPFEFVSIAYSGCRKESNGKAAVCFPPGFVELYPGAEVAGSETGAVADTTSILNNFAGVEEGEWRSLLEEFDCTAVVAGMMDEEAFLEFLAGQNITVSPLAEKGFLILMILILLGGLGLNLTPCVLPMIPVNLAIIGAGASAGKKTGFRRGLAYGIGMALAYGVLGVVVIAGGGKFGGLNSSVWFNFVIAGIFFLLALSMFGVFQLDFTRFGGNINPGNWRFSGAMAAFCFGAVAALLAGACVAPVVIYVLVLGGDIYSNGNWGGLFLPLLLGIGMALPWPLVGAGAAVLPKPGKWMNQIKYIFGVMILLAAGYYGYLGFSLSQNRSMSQEVGSDLTAGLIVALEENKDVILDFRASWCKNCLAMERTTLQSPKVQEALKDYVFIPVQAENFDDPQTAALLDYFGVQGLPAFARLIIKNP